MFVVLALTFLIVSSCASKLPPKVSLTQIDTVHNQANEFHIDNYNFEQCKLETSLVKSFQLSDSSSVNPALNGGFWISYQDFLQLKGYGVTRCKEEWRKREKNNFENSK